MNHKKPQIAKALLTVRGKNVDTAHPDFKQHYIAIIIKQQGTITKIDTQTNGI